MADGTVARCGRETGTGGELWRLPAGDGGGMRAEEEAGVSDKWHRPMGGWAVTSEQMEKEGEDRAWVSEGLGGAVARARMRPECACRL